MTELARAGVGLFVVLVVPGALLLFATRVRLSPSESLALIPACSLAATFVLAEVLTVVGVPFGPIAFLALVASLGGLDCLVFRRHRRAQDAPDKSESETPRAPRTPARATPVTVALVIGAIVVTSATLLSGMSGRATTPPAHDGGAHGFIVARVAHTENVRPSDVLVSDGSGRHQSYGYYPLALHASLAIAHRITGAEIGYLLDATSIFFAAVVFPLSLYALARFLVPELPLAAAFAALLGSLLSVFPYDPVGWSGIPLLVGMALVPVTVVLLVRTVTIRWSRRAAVLSGLVVTAGFAVHNSQLPLILLFAGALVVGNAVCKRSARVVTNAVSRLAWIGVIAGVLLLPTLSQVASGSSERASPSRPIGFALESVSGFLGRLLTLEFYDHSPQVWLALLAVVGMAFLLRRHRCIEWIVMVTLVGVLATVAATSESALASALTFPWYQESQRVAYNLAFFVPIFGGVALALAVRWVAQRFGAGTWAVLAVTLCILGAAYPVGVAHAVRSNRELVRASYTRSSPVQGDSVAAFDFIRRRSRSGDSVLNDVNVDGSLWMYAIAGLKPVFGLEPLKSFVDRSWKDRIYLVMNIGRLGRDQKVDDLVRRLRVRFVYFGDSTFRDMSHIMSLDTLRTTPGLHEVYNQGGSHVFDLGTPP